MAFLLEMRAFDVLDQIHITIHARDLSGPTLDDCSPITVVQTAVQAPPDADRRTWLQDALIAALEAL